MDSPNKEWLVSRLDGYVDAMASTDSVYGDSLAAAYLKALDGNDLLESLKSHLHQEPANRYIYDSLSEIPSPSIRELHVALEGFFLQRPFSISINSENEQLRETRYSLVWNIMEMIRLITNDFSCEKIFSVGMHSNDGYRGHMYIFPLNQDFLLLKTISRTR